MSPQPTTQPSASWSFGKGVALVPCVLDGTSKQYWLVLGIALLSNIVVGVSTRRPVEKMTTICSRSIPRVLAKTAQS